jgi:hypothetical protein
MTISTTGAGQLIGLAADTKPTTYATGTRFFETDTGLTYYWNGTAWAQQAGTNSKSRYDYVVSREGSTYIAKNDGWNVVSSSSTAETVIQYAIDNATAGSTIALKHAPNSWFQLTDGLNMVDKKIRLVGINDNYTTLAGSGSNAWGGTVLKKNYAVAEPFIDMANTGFMVNGLENLRLVGNSTSGDIGVKFFNARKNIFRNVSISGFDTGVEAGLWTDCDIYSLRISDCLTYGFKTNFSGAGKLNTCRFYGGSISSNPTNLYVDSSGMNDVNFFGTQFEGLSTGHVKSVQIESGANQITFICSSFEKNGETTPVCVYDGGNNNAYIKCRFDSDTSYTPLQFRSTAKNNNVIGCTFQTNTAATTQSVLIDSSATDITFRDNKKGTSTVGTVTLTDNGTRTLLEGNAQMGTGWEDKGFVLDSATSTIKIPFIATIVRAVTAGQKIYTNLQGQGFSTTETLASLPINFTFEPKKITLVITNNSNNANTIVTLRDDAAAITNATITILTTDTVAGTNKTSSAITAVVAPGSKVSWEVDNTSGSSGTQTFSAIVEGYIYR